MARPPFRTRMHVFVKDAFTCVYCGRSAIRGELFFSELSVDHVYPHALGGRGGDHGSNLRCSCRVCNELKGSRVFDTLEDARAFIQRERKRRARKAIRRMMRDCENSCYCLSLLEAAFTVHRLIEGEERHDPWNPEAIATMTPKELAPTPV